MSTISSKIMVQTMDDPSTILGTLLNTGKPLVQHVDRASGLIVPDWEKLADNEKPVIYVSVMKNGKQKGNYILPESIVWKVDNDTISFDNSGNSIAMPGYVAGTFHKETHNASTESGGTVAVPALRIQKNMASSGNIDNDIIQFSGTYIEGGANIPLDMNINVRISELNPNTGMVGMIMPATAVQVSTDQSGNPVWKYYDGGDFALEDDVNVVAMYTELYTTEGTVPHSEYVVDWHIGPNSIEEHSSPVDPRYVENMNIYTWDDPSTVYTTSSGLVLSDKDVVDYTVITANFYKRYNSTTGQYEELIASAIQEVDDLNDVEMMYIKSTNKKSGSEIHGSGQGNVAYLRPDEKVEFEFWVGKQTSQAVDSTFNFFYVKFLNNLEETDNRQLSTVEWDDEHHTLVPVPDTMDTVITDDEQHSDCGYRYVDKYDDQESGTLHKGYFTVDYPLATALGTRMTGLIAATSDPLPHDPRYSNYMANQQ